MTGIGALAGSLVGAAAIGGGRDRRYRHPNAGPPVEAHLARGWKLLVVFGGLGGLVGLVAFPMVRFVSPWLPSPTRHRKRTLIQQAVDLVAVLVAGSLALVILVGGFVGLFMLGLRLLE